jgi:hypothetical protein
VTTAPGKVGALFLARPETHLWVLALAVQAGLWAVVAPFLWQCCREFGPDTRRAWAAWLLLSAAGIVLLVALARAGVYGPAPSYPLAHHAGRIGVLTIVGLILLGPGLLAMCLIWQRLRTTVPPKSGPDGADWPAAAGQAGKLLEARERLTQVLLALGLAVGAVTLATGALRNAVLSYYRHQDASQFPAFYPWLYGAGATVVLAAAYFPAYFALQRASKSLIDATYPLDQKDRPDQGWYADRASFTALLKLDISPMQSFGTGVAILAPLLGSLLGTLLPVKGMNPLSHLSHHRCLAGNDARAGCADRVHWRGRTPVPDGCLRQTPAWNSSGEPQVALHRRLARRPPGLAQLVGSGPGAVARAREDEDGLPAGWPSVARRELLPVVAVFDAVFALGFLVHPFVTGLEFENVVDVGYVLGKGLGFGAGQLVEPGGLVFLRAVLVLDGEHVIHRLSSDGSFCRSALLSMVGPA